MIELARLMFCRKLSDISRMLMDWGAPLAAEMGHALTLSKVGALDRSVIFCRHGAVAAVWFRARIPAAIQRL